MTKPGDFLIGVLDFFAILLPGGIATWLVTRHVPADELSALLSFGPAKADALALWTAFLLSSYVLGHFVFMAGSRLDPSYDRRRRRAKPVSRDKTYQAANALRTRLTPSLADSDFTTLKWTKVYVQIHAEHARTEIDRLEANSKFFRSLVVVSILMTLHFLLKERLPAVAIASVALGAMAYKRYGDQRWKMSELSYATAVILDATKPVPPPSSGAPEEPA